jgi:hypothetical protein
MAQKVVLGPREGRPRIQVRAAAHPFCLLPRLGREAYEAKGGKGVSILWILLIVILVLALLGFFSRGYW